MCEQHRRESCECLLLCRRKKRKTTISLLATFLLLLFLFLLDSSSNVVRVLFFDKHNGFAGASQLHSAEPSFHLCFHFFQPNFCRFLVQEKSSSKRARIQFNGKKCSEEEGEKGGKRRRSSSIYIWCGRQLKLLLAQRAECARKRLIWAKNRDQQQEQRKRTKMQKAPSSNFFFLLYCFFSRTNRFQCCCCCCWQNEKFALSKGRINKKKERERENVVWLVEVVVVVVVERAKSVLSV